jgi:UDP-sugar transporter A1/2/3
MIFDARILAFLSLLIIQVFISIVYKFSQTKGTYAYSPLSAIASAEFIKLCISLTFLLCSVSIDEITTSFSVSNTISSRLLACYRLFQQEVKKMFIVYTFGLSLLYVINNQLAFVLYLYVDIASISMFKSFSSFISAILLWGFFERNISKEQWGSIILQVTGLCIVQYDSCQNKPFLAFKDYSILIVSTLITSICSVLNERLIKTYSVNIHIQNGILYSFGLMLNLCLFFFLPDLFGHGDSKKHFFEGYSLSVYAIVLCNSIIGIAITLVYKYADAIVKTFSTACATGVLLYINVAVFKLKANLTVFLGAIVIFVSSYLFLLVKPTPTITPVDVDTPPNEINESKWTQYFGWKCRLLTFAIGSLVFYFATSLFRNGTLFHSINTFHSTNIMSSSPNILRIEGIRRNRSIVMHGVNLCGNNTLNDTRVLINSNVCFPVEICSSTVVSCYLQETLNNESLSDTMNISLTTSVQGSSTLITINTTIPYTRLLSYWEKNDVVLVVQFNYPQYERIPFLTIYRFFYLSSQQE